MIFRELGEPLDSTILKNKSSQFTFIVINKYIK